MCLHGRYFLARHISAVPINIYWGNHSKKDVNLPFSILNLVLRRLTGMVEGYCMPISRKHHN